MDSISRFSLLRSRLNFALCLLCVAFTLFLTACSTSNLIQALDGVQIATTVASTALPVLCGAAIIPAPLCAPVEAYIAAAGTAAARSATELASDDMNATKVSSVIDIFASIAVPLLPPGSDPRIGGYIAGVDGAIKAFLSVLGPTKLALARSPALASGSMRPSRWERHKLAKIHDQALAAAAAVRK